MVYLLKRHSLDKAIAKYSRAVRNYYESNARIGIRTRPFRAAGVRQKMTAVSCFIDSLPKETNAAAIYRKLMSTNIAALYRRVRK